MVTIDYSSGLHAAFFCSIFLLTFFMSFSVYSLIRVKNKDQNNGIDENTEDKKIDKIQFGPEKNNIRETIGEKLLITLRMLCSLLCFSIGTFLVLYVTFNFFQQPFTNIDFYKAEIRSDILILRGTTVFICLKSIFSLIDLGLSEKKMYGKVNWKWWNYLFRPQSSGYEEIDNLRGTSMRSEDITFILMSQYAFYSLIMLTMWFFIFAVGPIIELKISFLILFFVADDWVIISDYIGILKGRILNSHRLRIRICNFLLLSTSIIALIRHDFFKFAIALLLFSFFLFSFKWVSQNIDKTYDFFIKKRDWGQTLIIALINLKQGKCYGLGRRFSCSLKKI